VQAAVEKKTQKLEVLRPSTTGRNKQTGVFCDFRSLMLFCRQSERGIEPDLGLHLRSRAKLAVSRVKQQKNNLPGKRERVFSFA
jgi:hypothetical protein